MKNILLISLFMMLFSMSMDGQKMNRVAPADTLNTTASADTSEWLIPFKIHKAGNLRYTMIADSLSGATEGIVTVYTAPKYLADTADWFPDTTFVINGVQTLIEFNSPMNDYWIKFVTTSGTNTQSTGLKQTFTFKKNE